MRNGATSDGVAGVVAMPIGARGLAAGTDRGRALPHLEVEAVRPSLLHHATVDTVGVTTNGQRADGMVGPRQPVAAPRLDVRSEERRGGTERRSRWSPYP